MMFWVQRTSGADQLVFPPLSSSTVVVAVIDAIAMADEKIDENRDKRGD